MKKVHWRPLSDHPLYWVGSNGQVRSFKKDKPGYLSLIPRQGYLRVSISCGISDKTKYLSVNRLVASAFVRNRLGLSQVNHEDGNKLNNNHTNLKWVDQVQNMAHAVKNGLTAYGSKNANSKLNDASVLEMMRKFNDGQSAKYLCMMYGIATCNFYAIKNRRTWKHLDMTFLNNAI